MAENNPTQFQPDDDHYSNWQTRVNKALDKCSHPLVLLILKGDEEMLCPVCQEDTLRFFSESTSYHESCQVWFACCETCDEEAEV